VKNTIKYILQKILGFQTYLFVFSVFKIKTLHSDPKEKDFNPSQLKRYTFDDKTKFELDKCILVCANCHREIHHELKQKEKETQI
jgi:hypothetical protein